MGHFRSTFNYKQRWIEYHHLKAKAQRLAAKSAPLDPTRLDTTTLRALGISQKVTAILSYFRDVEGYTDGRHGYLHKVARNPWLWLMPTQYHFAFKVWSPEEKGHELCLAKILADAGHPTGESQPILPELKLSRGYKLCRAIIGIALFPARRLYIAGVMAWGAINELTTLEGYKMARCHLTTEEATLDELLRQILIQEARHYTFYLEQASYQLRYSWFGRRFVSCVLTKYWKPVGSGEGFKDQSDFMDLMDTLVGNTFDAKLRAADNQFDAELQLGFRPFEIMLGQLSEHRKLGTMA